MSSHSVEVYYYLGLSYDKIKEKEKAREFLSRVIELALPNRGLPGKRKKKSKKLKR